MSSQTESNEKALVKAAEILSQSRNAVAFSGAGVSAESGIPTFRDAGGLWDRLDPDKVATVGGLMQTLMAEPGILHDFLSETWKTFHQADPNPGHAALARLEEMGILRSIVTQNIDDLHRIAGSSKVHEVHGNLYRWRCLNCDSIWQEDRTSFLMRFEPILNGTDTLSIVDMQKALPACQKCGGMMRPDVVLFGEAVQKMPESYIEAGNSDVMLILGTSGVVFPAGNIPIEAKNTGSKIIEINPEASAFGHIVDVRIDGASGEWLPRLVDLIEEKKK